MISEDGRIGLGADGLGADHSLARPNIIGGRRGEALAKETTAEVPILMYHSIDADGPVELSPYRISPAAFDSQMRFLAERGYYSISLDEWVAAISARQHLPGRPIIITFDDGYMNFLHHAWPSLQRADLTATMFVVTDKVGLAADWDAITGENPRLMNWNDLRSLRDQGLLIGSHSATHSSLVDLKTPDVISDVTRARDRLMLELGIDTRCIAFPYGHSDDRVRGAVAAAGYTIAVDTWGGISTLLDKPLSLPRIEIFPSDDLVKFAAKIARVAIQQIERPAVREVEKPIPRIVSSDEFDTRGANMPISPENAQRLAAQLDSLVGDFVALHNEIISVSGQPANLQAKISQLFCRPTTGKLKHVLGPNEVIASGIRVGFEKDARVALDVEAKIDHNASPDNCLNTLEFGFSGPSRWLSLEIPAEWADLRTMQRYQIGIYATANRKVSGRLAWRLPGKDGKPIDVDFAHFELDKDRRSVNKSGELRRIDFVNFNTDKRPILLFILETNNLPDLTLVMNYLTVYFD